MGLIYNASITTIEKKKIELTTKKWGLIIKKKKKTDSTRCTLVIDVEKKMTERERERENVYLTK